MHGTVKGRRGEKAKLKSEKGRTLITKLRQLKTGKVGEGIWRSHLWCQTPLQGYGIQENRKIVVRIVLHKTENISPFKLF